MDETEGNTAVFQSLPFPVCCAPMCSESEWETYSSRFTGEGGPWHGPPKCRISVDMVKQYLMSEITLAFTGRPKLGEELADGEFRIVERDEFFSRVCDHERAGKFLAAYAAKPVDSREQ